jgi:hypothetical protein
MLIGPVVIKIFLTTVLERISLEMRWSEIRPPIMDDRIRAMCGKEEIRPFYNYAKAEVTQEAIQCL